MRLLLSTVWQCFARIQSVSVSHFVPIGPGFRLTRVKCSFSLQGEETFGGAARQSWSHFTSFYQIRNVFVSRVVPPCSFWDSYRCGYRLWVAVAARLTKMLRQRQRTHQRNTKKHQKASFLFWLWNTKCVKFALFDAVPGEGWENVARIQQTARQRSLSSDTKQRRIRDVLFLLSVSSLFQIPLILWCADSNLEPLGSCKYLCSVNF